MNKVVQGKFGLGASVLRKEDNAFITGKGRYTDDISAENMLHGIVLRSPYAHANFEILDTSAALDSPGVHLVLTARDIPHFKGLTAGTLPQKDGSSIAKKDIPILCDGVVRHVGDAVAFIVADTVEQARNGAELIDIDYDMQPAICDTEGSLADDAPLVYGEDGTNHSFTIFMGDDEKTDAAFAKASHVTKMRLINNRLISNFMEPRSCISQWSDEEDRFNMTVCSQGVFGIRNAMCHVTGLAPEKIHVMTPDVGGGFGTKVFAYREYPLTMEAAKRLGRPVKWTSDRTEHFVADAHGRDNVTDAEMAMDENGRFLALRVRTIANMGAYLHSYGPFIPNFGLSMATGLYDIDTMAVEAWGVFTHTTPIDAYRGAGRPEAAYIVERLVDQCARELNMGRDEIRALNYIKPEQMPYTTQAGRMYDTGEFEGHMKECMQKADWNGFEARNDEAKARGKFRGIGMGCYIEACAFAGSEPAFLELLDDGTVTLKIGTQTNGQGHATAYSQLAAEKLGLDYEKIEVRQGDTDELKSGGGTGGSRSVPLGGASVSIASEALAEKIKQLAADQLEAAAADIELDDGQARVVGTDRAISFSEIAKVAKDPNDLKADGEWKQGEATYPNGTHIAEVEVDPETGTTEIVNYVIVDDYGVTVNPILLAGQVHGGVAQSIGQCLQEKVVYDDEGQLLTASFMDYSMPRADNVPGFEFHTRNVPSTTNVLGIKGAGEAGTIGATPAVMNAVCDALARHNGTQHIDMPVTPEAMWEAANAK